MNQATDPFDRAVERESRLRRRAAAFESRGGLMRFFVWLGLALGGGWAALLAGHWAFLGDPRWLAVLHTVVFAVVTGYYLVATVAIVYMKRRRPDMFEGI